MNITDDRIKFLRLLSEKYRSRQQVCTEIINLQAILNLPKGTEHFMSDLHGENEAFVHILNSASGVIREKVDIVLGDSVPEQTRAGLATLIYYPNEKLPQLKAECADEEALDHWYTETLLQLIDICRLVSSKHTRQHVRSCLPSSCGYILDELLHAHFEDHDKDLYYGQIVGSIIENGRADRFIVRLCELIKRLAVDKLHIVGDLFDRGPRPDIILDQLMRHHHVDIQWGNHDVVWMGAAAGSPICVCTVLKTTLAYHNHAMLEDCYGINLRHLQRMAEQFYGNDDLTLWMPHTDAARGPYTKGMLHRCAVMHKAISIIQFKLEAAMIDSRPEWHMQERKQLEHIDFERKVFVRDGKEYAMRDCYFPTIDPKSPYRLTAEEQELVNKLHHSFSVSDKLNKHIQCLFSHGCMYGIFNSNLLFHASVPLNADGSLKEVDINGEKVKGRALLDKIGLVLRSAFNSDTEPKERKFAVDYFWYLWCGVDSPLFDKSKMTTFERYFLEDKTTHTEEKGYYYRLRDDEKVCDMILDSFGVTGQHRHIINGHVPVRVGRGETPIKANGKLMVIDGGFAKAYHNTTGIAGYTLVFHSRGFQLVQHEPFTSAEEAIKNGTDIVSTTQIVEMSTQRMMVRDTDKGAELESQIEELKELLYAYRHGFIKESTKNKFRY